MQRGSVFEQPAPLCACVLRSCPALRLSGCPIWWGLSSVDLRVLDIVSQQPRSLIVTNLGYWVIAPFSLRLDDRTSVLFTTSNGPGPLPAGFSRILLYQPSDGLLAAMKAGGVTPGTLMEMPRRDKVGYRLYGLEPRPNETGHSTVTTDDKGHSPLPR